MNTTRSEELGSETQVYFKLCTPNKLYCGILERQIQRVSKKNSSKQILMLQKALKNLKKYPLPLRSTRDLKIIKGFGPKICLLIDKLLEKEEHATESDNMIQEYRQLLFTNNKVDRVEFNMQKWKEISQTSASSEQPVSSAPVLQASVPVDDGAITALEMPITTAAKTKPRIKMLANSFEIILLVDTQETLGKKKAGLSKTLIGLEKRKMKFETRRLCAGDFMWVCRDSVGEEIVLPYIIERKRLDDLASSIRDGRYNEQKFRLKICGLENVIYLIEDIENHNHLGLPVENLMQATINTQVHNGMFIKHTKNHYGSILYLSCLTDFLRNIYQNRDLEAEAEWDEFSEQPNSNTLQTFKQFTERANKKRKFTVRDIFVKKLLKMKSLSINKALAVANEYETVNQLIQKYDSCPNQKIASELLSKLEYTKTHKKIGSKLSDSIFKFYSLRS